MNNKATTQSIIRVLSNKIDKSIEKNIKPITNKKLLFKSQDFLQVKNIERLSY